MRSVSDDNVRVTSSTATHDTLNTCWLRRNTRRVASAMQSKQCRRRCCCSWSWRSNRFLLHSVCNNYFRHRKQRLANALPCFYCDFKSTTSCRSQNSMRDNRAKYLRFFQEKRWHAKMTSWNTAPVFPISNKLLNILRNFLFKRNFKRNEL